MDYSKTRLIDTMDRDRYAAKIIHEDEDLSQVLMHNNKGFTFFEPSNSMIKWIAQYANGRQIVDVGSGSGHVLKMLSLIAEYPYIMGIEPAWDVTSETIEALSNNREILHVLPRTVQESSKLLKDITNSPIRKSLILFCRPCHSDFVEYAVNLLPSGTEALLITQEETFHKYQDFGHFHHLATEIPFEGSSTDGEKVYQLIKP